jgi:glucose/mannose-6-phosphate isomerase
MSDKQIANALDDPVVRQRVDPSDMLSRIEGLPDHCEQGWSATASLELPRTDASTQQVLVLGMGGSAIAGDILRTLAERDGKRPVRVVRGYRLPSDVGEGSLVVACSHSGNTAETLTLLSQALDRRLPIVAVTTGGELAEIANARGFPLCTYAFAGEPRSALGFQLMALVRIAELSGVLERAGGHVEEAVGLLRLQSDALGRHTDFNANPAKQLASRLAGRIPVVFGVDDLAVAAHRWRTQFNENSKCWAISDELPELTHNAVVGFELPEDGVLSLHTVFLKHSATDERLTRVVEATANELARANIPHETVEAEGHGTLARVLSAIYTGDFVSYYLALLNGVDPSPVPPIERLKERLAGR